MPRINTLLRCEGLSHHMGYKLMSIEIEDDRLRVFPSNTAAQAIGVECFRLWNVRDWKREVKQGRHGLRTMGKWGTSAPCKALMPTFKRYHSPGRSRM